VVRRFSSADKPERIDADEMVVAVEWARQPRILPATAGAHRFVWDLHYAPPTNLPREYPISAIYHDTPSEPLGPVVQPGEYVVQLSVGGKTYRQPLKILMDPRVTTSSAALKRQYELSMRCYDGLSRAQSALDGIQSLRKQLKDVKPAAGPAAEAAAALDEQAGALAGSGGGGRRGRGAGAGESLSKLRGDLNGLLGLLQAADVDPTVQATTAVAETERKLTELITRWEELKSRELATLNEKLKAAKGEAIKVP
jgi:hypothetical protein